MGKTFFSNYGFRILLVVVFMLSFIWMGTKRTLLSNSNNVTDWLPESFLETQEYNWFLEHFPFESFVVVSWEGCTLDDSRVEVFAQKLVPGQTEDNMDSWMTDSAKLTAEFFVPEMDLEADVNEDLPKTPVNGETEELRNDETEQPADPPAPTHYFKSVLTGPRLLRFLMEKYGPDSPFKLLTEEQILDRLNGVLIGPDRTAADGSPLPIGKYKTAMIITLNKPANEKELRVVLDTIRKIGIDSGVQPPPKKDNRRLGTRFFSAIGLFLYDVVIGLPYENNGITMGGPPVDNVAIGYEGERTLYRLAGICAAIGLGISLACFRSLRLTMFVFWTSILAAGISLAMVWLTGSRCDAIMLSMPALIYVLSMSGAVHIINYYHEAIRESGLPGAAEKAISLAWYPCFFAAFTTAIGLGSAFDSDYQIRHLLRSRRDAHAHFVVSVFAFAVAFFPIHKICRGGCRKRLHTN